MKLCLLCKNNTTDSKYHSICDGCLSLLSCPEFCCHQCGVELQQKGQCGSCQKAPPAFSHTYFSSIYQAPIDKWVMSLKFGKNIVMSRLFAELMAINVNKTKKQFVLMPVPLHKSRLRKRGYNQAYEIAKELRKICKREVDTSLCRTKNTAMQAQLKFKDRVKNVRNAFKLKKPIQYKKVILIDDVMTTGNTLKECAKVLKKAGVEEVRVIVFARKSI